MRTFIKHIKVKNSLNYRQKSVHLSDFGKCVLKCTKNKIFI